MSAIIPVLELLSCLGYGAAFLRLFGRGIVPGGAFGLATAFVIGLGVLGWLMFFIGAAGLFHDPWLWAVLLSGLAGLPWIVPSWRDVVRDQPDATGMLLLALLAIVFALDGFEALAPPTDADSLAYHFAVPRQFIRAGALEFIYRSPDGAIPYLLQMGYVLALALGGERALTAWTGLTGWIVVGAVYAFARSCLPRNWALALALVFATLPVVIYGAGTGQIETRLALFTMVSVWAAGKAIESGDARFAALAGATAGFYAAAKYTGLLYLVAVGVCLLFHRRRFAFGALFSGLAILAGFQWYAWNAIHTGDPVFPMLFQWLGRENLAQWPLAHDRYFRHFLEGDRPLERSLLNLILYPFLATLHAPPETEAKLIGLGPFGLLVLPFAVLGAWRFRDRLRPGVLWSCMVAAGIFYVLWFITGSSQRVRHLLPIAPLLLIAMTVAAERLTRNSGMRRPLLAAFAITIAIQLAGTGLFGLKFLRYAASSEDRESFLRTYVSFYAPVPWINANLQPTDRLLIGERQLFYFLDVPVLFASPFAQGEVNLQPEQTDPYRLLAELCAARITHVLLRQGEPGASASMPAMVELARGPVLAQIEEFTVRVIGLKTLPGTFSEGRMEMLRLIGCGG
jgi:4-amino-4-deoxy-L-arabinose transferase-like glycosyltransferase